MRKRLFLVPLFIMSIFITSSCNVSKKKSNNEINNNPSSMYIKYDTEDYEITEPTVHSDIEVIYDCNNGFKYKSYLTVDNRALRPTKNPVKKASTFVGWYSDEELKNEYNFNSTHDKAITIYAKYETNYEELSNLIYEETILSNVKVVATFSDRDDFTGNKVESVGSGIIFSASETGYYAITNNHVLYKENSSYIFEKYEIYDCYNNVYRGTISYSDVNSMKFNINLTTYQNKIRVNLIEIEPQDRPVSYRTYDTSKHQTVQSLSSMILKDIRNTLNNYYEGYEFIF